MMDSRNVLYIIRGVPGSGKSTLARQLEDVGLVERVFEADDYHYDVSGNYHFVPENVPKAHKQCQEYVRHWLSYGWSVAVSNTTTRESDVQTYIDIAKEQDANFIVLTVENWHGGKDTHNVPEPVKEKMRKQLKGSMKL